jgi:hypothetical protein
MRLKHMSIKCLKHGVRWTSSRELITFQHDMDIMQVEAPSSTISLEDIFPTYNHLNMKSDLVGEPMLTLVHIKCNHIESEGSTHLWLTTMPCMWDNFANFKGRHGTWCLGQILHNTIIMGGMCIGIMH